MSQAKEYDLISLYYMKQMAWDLKSVLKSKALGKDSESMEYLTMHAEELVGRRDSHSQGRRREGHHGGFVPAVWNRVQ